MHRTLTITVLGLLVALAFPGAAAAGGPTSVLITEPSTGKATALYYTAPEYSLLERLLSAGSGKRAAPDVSGGTSYNVTWMAHDVHPWRRDHVRVTSGSVYVATTTPDATAREITTYGEVSEPKRLIALLDRIFAGQRSAAAPARPAAPSATTPPEPEVVLVPGDARTVWYSVDGWRWALPGALGGLLAGLLGGLLAARRRAPEGPRQLLLDREPTTGSDRHDPHRVGV